MAHRVQVLTSAADHVRVIPSARRTLLPVVLAAATFALPAVAEAKPSPRGKVCAGASAKLRPSPLRACVRVRKAPKALPSAAVKRDAVVKGKRRRALESSAGYMMG
jgi:hypothetical protein